ncbi:MAG: hypothetical protein K2L59_02245 [Muribaculaceae bacterium]|nr:hypothetical protein [Muribaculaceae bacterium]
MAKIYKITETRLKRDIWLVLSIVMFLITINRTAGFINLTSEWWEPLSSLAIGALCVRLYISHRKAVKVEEDE